MIWLCFGVLIELVNEKKLHTLLLSILKHLYDFSSPVMTKVPLPFHLGNKTHPFLNLPKKHRLILLFVVVNLSRFSLWLIVGSLPIIVVFVLLPLSKLSLNRNFFYLQVMVSVVFKLHDTEEEPLQWLWSRNDLTPRND